MRRTSPPPPLQLQNSNLHPKVPAQSFEKRVSFSVGNRRVWKGVKIRYDYNSIVISERTRFIEKDLVVRFEVKKILSFELHEW